MTTANATFYGLKVTRTKHQPGHATHTVWSGYRPEDRAPHEQFIREHCYDPEFDGELLFEPVEAPVIVTQPGLYSTFGLNGVPFRVAAIKPDGACFGYYQRRTPKGRWRDRVVGWFYVTGDHFDAKVATRLLGLYPGQVCTPGTQEESTHG